MVETEKHAYAEIRIEYMKRYSSSTESKQRSESQDMYITELVDLNTVAGRGELSSMRKVYEIVRKKERSGGRRSSGIIGRAGDQCDRRLGNVRHQRRSEQSVYRERKIIQNCTISRDRLRGERGGGGGRAKANDS